MGPTQQRRWERVAELEERLREAENQIGVLTTQLRAADTEAIKVQPWMNNLRAQEVAVIVALRTAYPRVLDVYSLDEAIPRRDHASDRTVQGVHVAIHGVRKKLGADVVETVKGYGWKLSAAFVGRMSAQAVAG